MPSASRQAAVIAGVLLAAAACAWVLTTRREPRTVEAGFWFDPIDYRSTALGPLDTRDLEVIAAVARREIRDAFRGLRVAVSARRDTAYHVRVVPELRDPRFRAQYEVAGASYGFPGLGGSGAVSFRFLAGGALLYAPPAATRDEILAAIGRGIGRSAVHELAHQLLPRTDIHGPDVRSYEYDSASRREHYYGDVRWDVAWPLLQARLGNADPAAGRR
jgi:hypothetical protein